MNAPVAPAIKAPRHEFTWEELQDLRAKGFMAGVKRLALHDGDIVHMPDDGDLHISVAMRVGQRFMAELRGRPFFVGVQTTLRLSRKNAPMPNIYVLAGGPPKGEVPAEKILLVVEVADTSPKADLTESASRFARHGVGEFWVIDANARVIHVHRDPQNGAYPTPTLIAAAAAIAPRALPDLAVCLDQIAPLG